MDRILMSWPRPDTANPYLLRLGSALAERGVRTRSAQYLAALCARPGAAPWLHLHWPEWMTHDPSRRRYRARAAYLLGLLDLARAQGVKIAWTAHNLLGHDDPHPDLGRAARSALLRRCSVVFGHFESAEGDVRELGFAGRFALTPHPHFADDYPRTDRGETRRALGISPHDRLLVSLGAIEPYKNLPAFARAFRAVAPARGVRWWVLGRAAHAETARELASAIEGDPRIEVRHGFAPRDALAAAVIAADAVVLPYRDFFTSGSAVLALSLGTPVMAPPRHHLATLAGRDFFVPLDVVNEDSVTAALARVSTLDEASRQAARAHALSFDWATAARVIDTTLFGTGA